MLRTEHGEGSFLKDSGVSFSLPALRGRDTPHRPREHTAVWKGANLAKVTQPLKDLGLKSRSILISEFAFTPENDNRANVISSNDGLVVGLCFLPSESRLTALPGVS